MKHEESEAFSMDRTDGRRDGEWRIGEAAQRAGVSVRTLHHYDRIGLLAPSRVSEAGYRWYDGAALLRLEQILFFRELGFPLEEIRRMMDSPSYDAREAMRRQRALLCMQRNRMDAMIARLDRAIQGDGPAELEVFSMKEIEKTRRQYAGEARERWGGTQAWQESEARTAGYGPEAWRSVQAGMDALMREFAGVRALEPQDERVQALVARWQAYITENFYPCTDEILKGLGEMYEADERFRQNIDGAGEGTAACMARAIAAYCARRGV